MSKDNLALDLEHGVRRWDRARWISVFSSHNPTIREVTECLGLGLSASSSTTNRGIPKFDNPDYRKLSSEVTKLSKDLPKERDALLDFAADPHGLDAELDELLGAYGPSIWGKDADRTCLLTPDPAKKTYNKDLFYEEPEHKEILRTHLHRWIVIKACYCIRNMKLKRPSGANDYDTVADIDGESQLSPQGTPQSLSPPERDASAGTELDVKPPHGRKRKTETFGTLSDGEEYSLTPVKRPYSTLPANRRSKSPRKSLHSTFPGANGSTENVPPLPSHKYHLSPSPANGVDPPRQQLSPLSNNELNGAARPPTTSTPSGFTAVNSGGFTAVNPASSLPEPPRDASHAASREPPLTDSPHQRDEHGYTSPYDTASYTAAARQPLDSHSTATPSTGPVMPAHSVRALQLSTTIDGASSRDSPVSHTGQHGHIASQPTPPQSQQQHPLQVRSRAHTPSQTHGQVHQQLPPRSNTPGSHHFARALALQSASRSSTPHAPAAASLPPSAPNTQTVPTSVAPKAHTARAPTHPAHHGSPSHHHPPTLRSQHAPTKPELISVVQLRLLQFETTTLLLQYFFPSSTSPPDEGSVLNALNLLWYHGEVAFRPLFQLPQTYDLTSHIFFAWLHERHAISALQNHLAAQPGVPASSALLVDRLLAMNDLRVMRLKWKNMSPIDGVSPEDMLVRAFMVITGTEGTEFLWRDGLARLEKGVFEWLRREDGKMVVQRR